MPSLTVLCSRQKPVFDEKEDLPVATWRARGMLSDSMNALKEILEPAITRVVKNKKMLA
jgi:hypothetical protein